MNLNIGSAAQGVLPSQMIEAAIKSGWIFSNRGDVPIENINRQVSIYASATLLTGFAAAFFQTTSRSRKNLNAIRWVRLTSGITEASSTRIDHIWCR